MKTYKSFVAEAVPLLAAAGPILGALKAAAKIGLAGYGAYQTGKSLQKGDMTGAALNAVQTVNPLGRLGLGAAAIDMFRPKGEQQKPQAQQQQQKPQSGMTAAQQKAAQDKANAARRSGQMSDIRGSQTPGSSAAAPAPKPTAQPSAMATRAFSAPMPSFKGALNLPNTSSAAPQTSAPAQSRLDKALSGIKPGAGVPQDAVAKQAETAAKRLQQRMRQMKNTPAAIAKGL